MPSCNFKGVLARLLDASYVVAVSVVRSHDVSKLLPLTSCLTGAGTPAVASTCFAF